MGRRLTFWASTLTPLAAARSRSLNWDLCSSDRGVDSAGTRVGCDATAASETPEAREPEGSFPRPLDVRAGSSLLVPEVAAAVSPTVSPLPFGPLGSLVCSVPDALDVDGLLPSVV